MNVIVKCIVLIVAEFLVLPGAYAETVHVTGVVTDSSSASYVDSAAVYFVRFDTQEIFRTTTDASGRYAIDIPVGVTAVEESAPGAFRLRQNYPNPFNPSTTIEYEIDMPGAVRLDIYSITGQRVITLVDGAVSGGMHRAVWDGRDEYGRGMGAGVYLYRLSAGNHVETRKMLLLDGGARNYTVSATTSKSALQSTAKTASSVVEYGITVDSPRFSIIRQQHSFPSENADTTIDFSLTPMPSYSITKEEAKECEKRFKSSFPNAYITWNYETGTVKRINGDNIKITDKTVTESNVAEIIINFFNNYPELFTSNEVDITLSSQLYYESDSYWYVRFIQTFQGIQLTNGAIMVELTTIGTIRSLIVDIEKGVDVYAESYIKLDTAWKLAEEKYSFGRKEDLRDSLSWFLIWKNPETEHFHLIWYLFMAAWDSTTLSKNVYFDAHTGQVLYEMDSYSDSIKM